MWRIRSNKQLIELNNKEFAHVVWVPSDEAVFYRADLPLKQKQVWEKTAGYALEEKLASSIENTYFLIGNPDDKEGIPVVTLPKLTMEYWFSLLKEKNIKAKNIWLDFLAVPFDENDEYAVVWHEKGDCILRFGMQECVTGSPEWLYSIIKYSPYANNLRIYSDDIPSLHEAWQSKSEDLPCSLEEKMYELSKSKTILSPDLIQGKRRSVSTVVSATKPWYWTAVATIVLGIIYLTEISLETKFLNSQTEILKKVSERTFLNNFPGIEVINIRAQVSRQLEQVNNYFDKKSVNSWTIMRQVDDVFSSCKSCKVERIKFFSTLLSIEISTSKDFKKVIRELANLSNISVETKFLPEKKGRKLMQIKLASKE